MEPLDGYAIPVQRALTEPMLMAGVPREVAILNGTLTAVLVMGLHSLLALPVGLAIHGALALAMHHDTQGLQVLARHLGYRAYYHP